MTPLQIFLLVLGFFIIGSTVLFFSKDIDNMPYLMGHPPYAGQTGGRRIDGLLFIVYIFIFFLVGCFGLFIVIGSKLIKFINKKRGKENIESDDCENSDNISIADAKKLIAYTIVGIIAITFLLIIISIILSSLNQPV